MMIKLILTLLVVIPMLGMSQEIEIDSTRLSNLPLEAKLMFTYGKKVEGKKVPSMNFIDINGNNIVIDSTTELAIIDFWFIACPPCVSEIPDLNKLTDEFPKVQYIGITIDKKEPLNIFLAEHPFSFNIIANDTSSKKMFDIQIYPTMIIIKDGIIIKGIAGGRHNIYDIVKPVINQYYSTI